MREYGEKKEVLQVPFNTTWDNYKGLVSYPDYKVDEWRDNYTFVATLKLDTYERGRSAAYFVWRDVETGLRYPMFLTFTEEVLKRARVTMGIISGEFTFAKRGTNYSIRMVFESEE